MWLLTGIFTKLLCFLTLKIMFFLLLRMQNLPLKARIPFKHGFVSVNKYIDPSFSLMYISLLILKFFLHILHIFKFESFKLFFKF